MSKLGKLYHDDELDPVLRGVLGRMLSQSPDRTECESVLERLRRLRPNIGTINAVPSRRRPRLAMATAASVTFLVLLLGSQTELWAEVAVDFQTKNQPASAGADDADSSLPPVSAEMRFLLMVHVFGLMTGLIGMLSAWVLSQIHVVAACLHPSAEDRSRKSGIASWGKWILLGSILLYTSGIALGGVWAMVAWGSFWRWDPRECLALVTAAIALMWYVQWHTAPAASENSWPDARKNSLVAALAFWTIVLLTVVAPTYTDSLKTYGRPVLPNLISALMAINLAGVAAVGWLRRK